MCIASTERPHKSSSAALVSARGTTEPTLMPTDPWLNSDSLVHYNNKNQCGTEQVERSNGPFTPALIRHSCDRGHVTSPTIGHRGFSRRTSSSARTELRTLDASSRYWPAGGEKNLYTKINKSLNRLWVTQRVASSAYSHAKFYYS